MKKTLVVLAIGVSIASWCRRAPAQNLLTDGGFESATAVPSWNLVESIFDQSNMMDRDFGQINSAQQQNFGPHSGPLALWLRAFIGGSTPGPNNLTNAILSQTVPAVVGEQYTFTGWSRFESNYPGGYDTLPSTSPLGAVPSPTTTTMKLEFLDSGGGVLGSAVTLDVKADRAIQIGAPFVNNNVYYQHSLMGTAPTGAANVRVTGEARKMVATEGNPDGGFYDDLQLRTASAPGTQLLANPSLDIRPDPIGPAWDITEVPGGQFPADPTVSTADFASRPEGDGQLGVWLRSFTGNVAQPADAILEQAVPGIPQAQYMLSGWSNFQGNYAGGLAGFPTQTKFEMEFLDSAEVVIPGSIVSLDLKADGQTNGAGWRQHSLMATSPAGTASVRVRAMGVDMVANPSGGQQSAFLDDLVLALIPPANVPGDYNGNGVVDAADYVVWRKNNGLTGGATVSQGDGTGDGNVNAADYGFWRNRFGNPPGSGSTALEGFASVPEPASCILLLSALACTAGLRRRRPT